MLNKEHGRGALSSDPESTTQMCNRDLPLLARPTVVAVLIVALTGWARPGPAQPAGLRPPEGSGWGSSLYRIAVPPVVDGGGAAAEAKVIAGVMVRDLTLLGLFEIVRPDSSLTRVTQDGVGIDAAAWTRVGARAVITALTDRSAGRITIDFNLHVRGQGSGPVLRRTYSGLSREVSTLTRRFGDDVVHFLTGERGIFNTKVAFVTTPPNTKAAYIYVMDWDGRGVYKLSNTGKQNVLPDWSPAGQLAYTSYLWGNADLFVVHSTGGRAQRISKWPGLNTGAAWSPDGKILAVTLTKDGNAELYLINARGELLRRLTRNKAIDTSPTWSPDGARLAFVSNRQGTPQIYVMSARGGRGRRLTHQGSYNQEPDWCPRKDRPLVAYTGRDEKDNYEIYTVHVQTGETRQLTQVQGSSMSPTWAPNGRHLGYVRSTGGIWVMHQDGTNQQQLYSGKAQTPAWSR